MGFGSKELRVKEAQERRGRGREDTLPSVPSPTPHIFTVLALAPFLRQEKHQSLSLLLKSMKALATQATIYKPCKLLVQYDFTFSPPKAFYILLRDPVDLGSRNKFYSTLLVLERQAKPVKISGNKVLSCKSGLFRESDDVHLQSAQFHVDRCCLANIADFQKVVSETWWHCSILDAWCEVVEPLVGFHPKPHAPSEVNGSGEAAPYRLGAAHLEARVEHNVPSPRKKRALASSFTPIERRFITSRLWLHVLCQCCVAKLEYPLQCAKPG